MSGDLRYCLNSAIADGQVDTVIFDSTVFGSSEIISLASVAGQSTYGPTAFVLGAANNITLIGPSAGVTINGQSMMRLFAVASGGSLTLQNLVLTGGLVQGGSGSAANSGGCIFNSGTVNLTNSTVTGNSVIAGSGVITCGGGIYNEGTLNVRNCTLSGNSIHCGAQAENRGGGIYNVGTANILSCTIAGNSLISTSLSNNVGGGIYNAGTANIANSTISGNSLSDGTGVNQGGGIFNGEALTLRNVTLSGNSSGHAGLSQGGGLCSVRSEGGVADTIIAANTASEGPDENGFIYSLGNNLIGNGDGGGFTNGVNGDQVGTGTAPINPLLGPLGNYGGPTQTMPLLPGSPAIDAGGALTSLVGDILDVTTTSFFVSGGLYVPDGLGFVIQMDAEQMIVRAISDSTITVTRGANGTTATTHKSGAAINAPFDQRGAPRIVGGPGSSAVDIGAYETGGFTIAVGSGNNQSAYTTSAFANRLVATVIANNAGDAVAGGQVVFTAPSSGASGTFAGGGTSAIVTTGANGTASAPIFTANSTVSSYTVLAIVPGITSEADFSLTNLQPHRVLSLTGVEAATNAEAMVHWTLTFEGAESGLAASNLALSGTSGNAAIGTPTTTDGGLTWTIPVTTGTNGTLGLSVANDTGLTPGLSSVLPFAGDTFTIDKSPTSTKLLAVGDPAPGAGTNGLPADATLTTFNTPAIDQEGNLAFLAKWSSDNGKVKGTGLFTGSACLAFLGGDVPGGETFKSLADPIIESGAVACLATLAKGRTSTAAVLRFVSTGALTVIARAGDVATSDGAMFKTFKAVAMAGDYLAVFAQVTGGKPRTTVADDLGLWIKEGANPLLPALRENQPLPNGKTLKTLTSFLAGNGSPGSGRGWLVEQAAVGGRVMAYCLCSDNTQAIVQVDASDVTHPVVLAQTGVAGAQGGPSTQGLTFASLGLPAVNGSGACAFLAALKPNAAAHVTAADARGVYRSTGAGGYDPVASIAGGNAGSAGAKFSVLKDPVLAADGAMAFPATIKGGTVKGLAGSTLWWRPANDGLTLLAQGGMQPPGVAAGAQWEAFTSLAIAAHRGPIFAATLVLKKGVVTSANASGVWGTDFAGTLRLLFRAGVTKVAIDGDPTHDKVVKSFTLLKALVGSTGETRSFNDAGEVVWLATFADKTTAIVTTAVP